MSFPHTCTMTQHDFAPLCAATSLPLSAIVGVEAGAAVFLHVTEVEVEVGWWAASNVDGDDALY